jgi:hypothetical protein
VTLNILFGYSAKAQRFSDFNAAMRRYLNVRVIEFTYVRPDAEKCDGVLTYPDG